ACSPSRSGGRVGRTTTARSIPPSCQLQPAGDHGRPTCASARGQMIGEGRPPITVNAVVTRRSDGTTRIRDDTPTYAAQGLGAWCDPALGLGAADRSAKPSGRDMG